MNIEQSKNTQVNSDEVWKQIPGFAPEYYASNTGLVRVNSRVHSSGYTSPAKILSACAGRGGYSYVTVRDLSEVKKVVRVCKLVALSFLPNPDNLPLLKHKDGNPKNNFVGNIEWSKRSKMSKEEKNAYCRHRWKTDSKYRQRHTATVAAYARRPDVREKTRARAREKYRSDSEYRLKMRGKHKKFMEGYRKLPRVKLKIKEMGRRWLKKPENYLKHKLRWYVQDIFRKTKKRKKHGEALRLLGCTIREFKAHLESKFTEGMSWENRGKWHLDHVAPLSSFNLTKLEDRQKAFHWSNYQPLWAKDNLSKGAKLAWRGTS